MGVQESDQGEEILFKAVAISDDDLLDGVQEEIFLRFLRLTNKLEHFVEEVRWVTNRDVAHADGGCKFDIFLRTLEKSLHSWHDSGFTG